MSQATAPGGAGALQALLESRDRFGKLVEKDFAAATEILVKKIMISAGQTTEDMRVLKATVGDTIFDSVLKSLSHYHARLLARRLDKEAPDLEVSTAAAACAHIRKVMGDETAAPAAEETVTETPPTNDSPSTDDNAPKNSYFGRKAFRTGN